MFTAVRPRESERRPSLRFRRSPPNHRRALVEAVTPDPTPSADAPAPAAQTPCPVPVSRPGPTRGEP
jgi:hypothetical protein